MRKYVDAVANLGKDYWDLGLAMAGGDLMGQTFLGQYDIFGNDDIIAGTVLGLASAFIPKFLNLEATQEGCDHRFSRNASACLCVAVLGGGEVKENVSYTLAFLGASFMAGYSLVSEYHRKLIRKKQSPQEE